MNLGVTRFSDVQEQSPIRLPTSSTIFITPLRHGVFATQLLMKKKPYRSQPHHQDMDPQRLIIM